MKTLTFLALATSLLLPVLTLAGECKSELKTLEKNITALGIPSYPEVKFSEAQNKGYEVAVANFKASCEIKLSTTCAVDLETLASSYVFQTMAQSAVDETPRDQGSRDELNDNQDALKNTIISLSEEKQTFIDACLK
jgi:hypothetical protein